MFDKQKASKPGQAPEPVREAPVSTPPLSTTPGAATGKVAVIGQGIEIDGTIGGSGGLLVEGHIKGSVDLPGQEVTIGKSGKVRANVTARVIRISGQVNGDLSGEEKVVISGSGNVRGNVKAPRVVLEDGAVFKGSIDMDPGESAAKVKALDSRPAARPAPPSAAPPSEMAKTPDLALKSS